MPGVRENGGQYTHAAIWAIIAFAILNQKDKAQRFLDMINPIKHSKTEDLVDVYKVEPYVIPADIYGSKNMLGRGGWTWYTGSSSWFYKAGIEYILGLKINKGIMTINPCIPNEWSEYKIRYEYKTSIYNITVKNSYKTDGIKEFLVDGQRIEEKQIKLIDNGRIYEVEVIF